MPGYNTSKDMFLVNTDNKIIWKYWTDEVRQILVRAEKLVPGASITEKMIWKGKDINGAKVR
ncbi:MAG: hypothetical protein ACRCYY_05290 [Trueperaceae bacterium]